MLNLEQRVFVFSILIGFIISIYGSDISGSNLSHELLIINGVEAEISKYPYVVSVRRKNCSQCPYEHHCGGSIYSEDIIITSARCVQNAEIRDLQIVAGSSFRTNPLQDNGMIFPIGSITIYPMNNIDLALIHSAIKIPLNQTLAIQAATFASSVPKVGTSATVVGWGQTSESGEYVEHLNEATVSILDEENCSANLLEHEICAGYVNGISTGVCHGDSGGPLLVDGKLVGIVSADNDCANPDNAGVYTNVVIFKEWIAHQALGIHIAFL